MAEAALTKKGGTVFLENRAEILILKQLSSENNID